MRPLSKLKVKQTQKKVDSKLNVWPERACDALTSSLCMQM